LEGRKREVASAPKESGVTICPNPKCYREIEEPILLNNLSTTPADQYYACPHCFIKLGADAENDEDITQESTHYPPLHLLFEKFTGEILGPLIHQKKKEKKEEYPVEPPAKKGAGPSGCPHHFGYLASHPKNASIPEECLICPKILECM